VTPESGSPARDDELTVFHRGLAVGAELGWWSSGEGLAVETGISTPPGFCVRGLFVFGARDARQERHQKGDEDPHPNPLPEYRERGKE
jgi:hypothetical protein